MYCCTERLFWWHKKKRVSDVQIVKEEPKSPLFTDDMLIYLENPLLYIKKKKI